MINQTAVDIGETSILSRAGGAPTLAVGMAQILAQAIGGKTMEAFWYHFAILFGALFILTAVDAGTRVGRFMIQDMLGHVYAPLGNTRFLPANLLGTDSASRLGVTSSTRCGRPAGGINTLWQLFGVGNQMLAGIALLLCTSVLVKMEARTVCLGNAGADRLAADYHPDGGRREDLSQRPEYRLHRAGA
jgi:carbon starvation protein